MVILYVLVGYTDPQTGGGGGEILFITKNKEEAEIYEKNHEKKIYNAILGKGPWPSQSYDYLSVEEYELDKIPKWLKEIEDV